MSKATVYIFIIITIILFPSQIINNLLTLLTWCIFTVIFSFLPFLFDIIFNHLDVRKDFKKIFSGGQLLIVGIVINIDTLGDLVLSALTKNINNNFTSCLIIFLVFNCVTILIAALAYAAIAVKYRSGEKIKHKDFVIDLSYKIFLAILCITLITQILNLMF